MKKTVLLVPILLLLGAVSTGCDKVATSDDIQRRQQEVMLKEATAATGMPAIKNFRERKILKDIIEMRDQDGLVTYTYLWSDVQGKLVFLCDSIGYGLPYATQYSNPEKADWSAAGTLYTIPQADPNGLFSPASAEGTWILCKNPSGKEVRPIYVEPRVIVSPFKLQ
jgi:hypothetical protein